MPTSDATPKEQARPVNPQLFTGPPPFRARLFTGRKTGADPLLHRTGHIRQRDRLAQHRHEAVPGLLPVAAVVDRYRAYCRRVELRLAGEPRQDFATRLAAARGQTAPFRFTFYWPEGGRWEGRDFAVALVPA